MFNQDDYTKNSMHFFQYKRYILPYISIIINNQDIIENIKK